jgi:hypothetical protein
LLILSATPTWIFAVRAARPCRSYCRARQHPCARDLQDDIEHEVGESRIAGDPVALALSTASRFSSALVNAQHCDISANVAMPVILYRPQEGRRQVAARLKTLRSVGATC